MLRLLLLTRQLLTHQLLLATKLLLFALINNIRPWILCSMRVVLLLVLLQVQLLLIRLPKLAQRILPRVFLLLLPHDLRCHGRRRCSQGPRLRCLGCRLCSYGCCCLCCLRSGCCSVGGLSCSKGHFHWRGRWTGRHALVCCLAKDCTEWPGGAAPPPFLAEMATE